VVKYKVLTFVVTDSLIGAFTDNNSDHMEIFEVRNKQSSLSGINAVKYAHQELIIY